MSKITPFLWFDNQLDEAIDLYTSVFPDARVQSAHKGPDGKTYTASFELGGQKFMALNGGPHHEFTDAISLFVACKDQAEVDHYWDALTADGGKEVQCGWLKDKFGISWQIVPDALFETMMGPDPEGAKRATDAMMGMKKLIVADLQKAYRGE